jgi:hypothetical protein
MKHLHKIAGKFRHHKTVALVVASLIISTQLLVGCKNENHMVGSRKEDRIVSDTNKGRSTRYLQVVGSCNQPTTIKIYDETGGVDPTDSLSPNNGYGRSYGSKPMNIMENKPFKNYVTTISKHVFAKVEAIGQCQGTAGKPQVELVFVYRPTISRGITPFNDFNRTKSPDTKQLDSPWAKLTLNKSPKLHMQAVFVWNERQFLLDEALIHGKRVSAIEPLLPIALETFDRWDYDYIRVPPIQKAQLVKQIPADILWLSDYHWMDDCDRWDASSLCGLQAMIEGERLGYSALSKVLIDRLFASPKAEIHYDSVLDLKDIFNISKYQVERSSQGFDPGFRENLLQKQKKNLKSR